LFTDNEKLFWYGLKFLELDLSKINYMKKVVLLLVFTLSMMVIAFAQDVKPTNDEIKIQRATSIEQMRTAAKEVGSTDAEIAKLKTIFESFFAKQDEIKADLTLTPEVRTTKLKEANASKDWKVKNVLGSKITAYSIARKRILAEATKK
jgi:hypothetical protein